MAAPPKRSKVYDAPSRLATVRLALALDADQLVALQAASAVDLAQGRAAVPVDDAAMSAWLADPATESLLTLDHRRAWQTLAAVHISGLLKTWHCVVDIAGLVGAANTASHITVTLGLSVLAASADGFPLTMTVTQALEDLGALPCIADLQSTLASYGLVRSATTSATLLARAVCRYIQDHDTVPPYTRPFSDRRLLLDTQQWRVVVDRDTYDASRSVFVVLWPDSQRTLLEAAAELEACLEAESSLLSPLAHPSARRGLYHGMAPSTDAITAPLLHLTVAGLASHIEGPRALFQVCAVPSSSASTRGSALHLEVVAAEPIAGEQQPWQPSFADTDDADSMMVRDTVGDVFADVDPGANSDKASVWRRTIRLYCLLTGAWTATHCASDTKVVARYRSRLSEATRNRLALIGQSRRSSVAAKILAALNGAEQGHVLVLVPHVSCGRVQTLRMRLSRLMFPQASPRYQKQASRKLLQRVVFDNVGRRQALIQQPWLAVFAGSLAVLLQTTAAEANGLKELGSGLSQPILFTVAGDLERDMVGQALGQGGVLESSSLGKIQLAARLQDGDV